MASSSLKVAFLWHMHQPFYRNPRTELYRLPWVRLHTVKDYYPMVARLESFPGIKANFNLVPSLVEQILDYARGEARELHLELSRKPVADLTEEEKVRIVQIFFLGNRQTMIEPHARYRSLLMKCMDLDSEYKVHAAIRKLKDQDFLDLQVWSNLAWMSPTGEGSQEVEDLRYRQRRFTEQMKMALLERQQEIMQSVLDRYRRLAQTGQIEIAMSPYFHPILPLLCDSESARMALPDVKLPAHGLKVPEDAKAQIIQGAELHRNVFGVAPVGMWPPEGGVSLGTAAVAAECGIEWIATDETILERTLGIELRDPKTEKVTRPDLLYRPRHIDSGRGEVVVFFRDRVLSDLISFEYKKMAPADAVDDFIERLEAIRDSLGLEAGESVVLVALDGENCWEFYDRGGDTFLRELYTRISNHRAIESVRLCDVLDCARGTEVLRSIYAGSWIDGSFSTWIGGSEDNAAWDLLSAARQELVNHQADLSDEGRRAAWRSIYAAQGSDWFWWYGGEHTSREDPEFDALFRSHIRFVYGQIGVEAPAKALHPIMEHKRMVAVSLNPAAIIKPKLDGRVTTFYEWKLAGLYESYKDGSRGSSVGRMVEAIYFGFDRENLYLRLDTSMSPQSRQFQHVAFRIAFDIPSPAAVEIQAPGPRVPDSIEMGVKAPGSPMGIRAVALEITEVAVPFAAIPAAPGDQVSFRITVLFDGHRMETRPIHGVISLSVPRPDFEAEHWSTL